MKDKVVIITGATKGMGLGSAKGMLAGGANVVLVYRNDKKRAKEVEEELSQYAEHMLIIQADVTKRKDRANIVEKTLKQFGRIDVLVNNAGVATTMGFMKVTEDEYDKILDVNLKAPIFLAQLVAEQMIKQGDGGSIINFASISGHRGMGGVAYEAAKSGLIIATQSMSNTLAKHGIRVNSISPGYHKTEMNKAHHANNTELHQELMKIIPLRRAAEAEEMAGPVIFLATDASSYMTGQDIIIDGGYFNLWPAR